MGRTLLIARETASTAVIDNAPHCVACNSTERVSIHYNALSCHGCKAFFRRTVFERREYCCSAEGRCELTDENRNQCRACRFQKCVKGGMNPKHVREERAKRRQADAELAYGDLIARVEEHPLTARLCELERDMDSGLRSERAELRRRVKEQFAIPDIDMTQNFRCERIMNDADISNAYYLAFLLLSEWAGDIPEFRVLPQADQMLLFRQNFMMFSWIHFVYRSVIFKQERVGVPLGNGSYIPYREEERRMMELKWQRTYGVIATMLVDMVGGPMADMDLDYEEYCILKAMSLVQFDNQLTKEGQRAVAVFRDQLLTALIVHIERRHPLMPPAQRSQRSAKLTLLFPALMQIGHLESQYVQQLSAMMAASNAVAAVQASGSSTQPTAIFSPLATSSAPPLAYTWDESTQSCFTNTNNFLDISPKQL